MGFRSEFGAVVMGLSALGWGCPASAGHGATTLYGVVAWSRQGDPRAQDAPCLGPR